MRNLAKVLWPRHSFGLPFGKGQFGGLAGWP
jgi:hypothetical protein